MKYRSFLNLALPLCFALAACDNGSDSHIDTLAIYPITEDATIIYADQTLDSIRVVSTKNWKLTTNDIWLSPQSSFANESSVTGLPGTTRCPIFFKTNTTGNIRGAYIIADNGEQKVSKPFVQAYWLNITQPKVKFSSYNPELDYWNIANFQNASFTLNVESGAANAQIDFQIYAEQATLECRANWLRPDSTSFRRGPHSVILHLDENQTGNSRSTLIKLTTSNGISNTITIVQNI